MEIILSPQCESLTGTLGRDFGYSIQKRTNNNGKTRFWGVRNSRGYVPFDGHLQFILSCACLAQKRLHIADIKVSWMEVQSALYEARHFVASVQVRRNYADKCKATYNARDIINLKITFGL